MSYEFFEPTQEINSYIDNGDTIALRGIIVGVINRDPTFATKRYDEILDYISKRLNIWDERVELPGEYEVSREKWDKEYFRKQLVWLSQNFNRERVLYIEDVGKHVYANEYTWGKEEAGNFYHPIPQKKERAGRSQGVIGGLIMALFVIVVIATVVLLVPELPSVLKIILVIAAISIVVVCIMTILTRRR